MRNALLIVLGLVIGVAGTVMAMASLKHGPSFPESLMKVQGHHMGALDGNVKQNRCAAADTVPHLQLLRSLANDIEPAFLPIEKEQDFRQKAGDLRASLDAQLAAPPANCAAVQAAQDKIGKACKACHDEFRS
jgi:cytochrome c556